MSSMKDELPESVDGYVIGLLKAERKRQGLSHETLGDMSGLHRSTISVIEARKHHATLCTLLKIARALDFSLGEAVVKAEKRHKSGRG